MAEDLKSSAQVWGGRNDISDSPPAYSGIAPEEPTVEQTVTAPITVPRRPVSRTAYDPLRRFEALSMIPFRKYDVSDGALSPDKITVTVKHSDLYSQPQHLLPFILEQASLPPKPSLRIVGTESRFDRVDFDLTLNLTHLLNFGNHKFRFDSAHVSPIQSGSRATYDNHDSAVPTRVATSVRQFCKDKGENKSFTLTRTVEGLPTEMLAGQIRNLAASVKYRGSLRIDFTCERSKVIVHRQPSSWFSSLLGLYPEKKYEVVETVWNLSDGSDERSDSNNTDIGLRAGHDWWQSWASSIRNAIITKHKGNVGIDDWLETRMGHIEQAPRLEWGHDHYS